MPIDLQRYPFRGAAVNVDIFPFTRLRDPGVEVPYTIFNWAADVLGEMTPTLDSCLPPLSGCLRVDEHSGYLSKTA